MSKLSLKLAAIAGAVLLPSMAYAVPISGSFSLSSFSGSYVSGTNYNQSATAQTATGLDFGTSGGAGNGFGTKGTATIGNSTGSFAGLDGTTASIADIVLATLANPSGGSTFITFGAASPITVSFSDASITRSSLGTSVTVRGTAIFTDGTAADTSTGMFTLAASSQEGMPTATQFTFTGNASSVIATTVPEPMSLALLGTGLVALGVMRRKSTQA